MILNILFTVILIGSIVIFISVSSMNEITYKKESHITNERLDKMFKSLKEDITQQDIKINDLKLKLDILEQSFKEHSKRIEKLEIEIRQLRTGSNSRYY